MRIIKILSPLLALVFLLTSCNLPLGNNSSQPGSSAAQPTSVPTPTATPTPTPQTRILSGEQELVNADYNQALVEFQTVVTTSNDPELIGEGQVGIGKVYFFEKKYDSALNQFNWILANFPSGNAHNLAQFFIARTYDAQQQYQQAADAYAAYMALAPGTLDSEVRTMQGDALLNAGNYSAALPFYQQALTTATTANKEALQIKIAQTTQAVGNLDEALGLYQQIYDTTSSDYTKAQMDYLMGQVYLSLDQKEDAYAKFQDAVTNYPTSNDTYLGLVILVDANQPVSDLNRGIIDYYAGQYGLAAQALERYINDTPTHDGTAHYYKALSFWRLGEYEKEVAEWDQLIKDHPNDPKYATAFLEKATTQWTYLNQYDTAAQTLLEFVILKPDAPEASQYLYQAGRIFESENRLDKAAKTWLRIIDEYPSAEEALPGLFEAGISYYRMGDYSNAQLAFQKEGLLATAPSDKAAAALWVGKTLQAQSKKDDANTYFQQAAAADPTGYYSIRAEQLLNGQSPFPAIQGIDLGVSLESDFNEAQRWMVEKFSLPAGTDLSNVGDLAQNPLFQRGALFLSLGFPDDARTEFDSLRQELQGDAVSTFRLTYYLVKAGLNRTAIYSARQVLDLAGLSQTATLTAPKFFNHIRFGVYFRDVIVSAAVENNIDPLLLFSIIRQESLFEGSIVSSAGARGLMQIMPDVGQEIANTYGWPPDYTIEDLIQPSINVRMGAHYLKKWLDYFNGDLMAALAAYNGGIGNAMEWKQLAGNDPDLFLEVVRFSETRDYIRYIAENYEIYKSIYTHP